MLLKYLRNVIKTSLKVYFGELAQLIKFMDKIHLHPNKDLKVAQLLLLSESLRMNRKVLLHKFTKNVNISNPAENVSGVSFLSSLTSPGQGRKR